MMTNRQQLNSIVGQSAQPAISKLGDVLCELMENQILPQQAKFQSVLDIWTQLLPIELRKHCKIIDIKAGQLKVLVDQPAYLYELQLCSNQLLKQLQQACPRARIKKIKFTAG